MLFVHHNKTNNRATTKLGPKHYWPQASHVYHRLSHLTATDWKHLSTLASIKNMIFPLCYALVYNLRPLLWTFLRNGTFIFPSLPVKFVSTDAIFNIVKDIAVVLGGSEEMSSINVLYSLVNSCFLYLFNSYLHLICSTGNDTSQKMNTTESPEQLDSTTQTTKPDVQSEWAIIYIHIHFVKVLQITL